MNFADKAKQLQAERVEKQRLASQQQAKAQEEAAEKVQQLAEVARQKAEELLPLFRQFDGFKICNEHVTIGAELKQVESDSYVCLKTVSVGLSGANQYTPSMVLLSVHYDPKSGTYHLNGYENRPRVVGTWIAVGNYNNTDQLMNAVAEEVSKL